MNVEILREGGIDYNAGVSRFLDDAALYEAVLAAFLEEDAGRRAREAYDRGDMTALLHCVHEAKGSGGNADLTAVYASAAALVELLRSGGYDKATLEKRFLIFEKAYLNAQSSIRKAMESA